MKSGQCFVNREVVYTGMINFRVANYIWIASQLEAFFEKPRPILNYMLVHKVYVLLDN